jgi:hypothetical protein
MWVPQEPLEILASLDLQEILGSLVILEPLEIQGRLVTPVLRETQEQLDPQEQLVILDPQAIRDSQVIQEYPDLRAQRVQ